MTQPIYAVTLATLREHGACLDGYNKVVRMLQGEPFSELDAERESYIKFSHDEPISLITIAKNNGLADALWALHCVPNCTRDARLFAVWAARQVEHLMADPRSKDALNISEHFANGRATAEEVRAAARAAARAAYAADAVANATNAAAAANAAYAAAHAAAHAADGGGAYADAAAAARAAARAADADAADANQLTTFIDMCEGRAPWQVKP